MDWFANKGQIIQILLALAGCILAGIGAWPKLNANQFFSAGAFLFYILVGLVVLSLARLARVGFNQNLARARGIPPPPSLRPLRETGQELRSQTAAPSADISGTISTFAITRHGEDLRALLVGYDRYVLLHVRLANRSDVRVTINEWEAEVIFGSTVLSGTHVQMPGELTMRQKESPYRARKEPLVSFKPKEVDDLLKKNPLERGVAEDGWLLFRFGSSEGELFGGGLRLKVTDALGKVHIIERSPEPYVDRWLVEWSSQGAEA